MVDPPLLGLRIVPGTELAADVRRSLRPGEMVEDPAGHPRRLPGYFYEVPSWQAALNTELAPNFGLWEFIDVDVREERSMRGFPRYVPCAVSLLAGQLQLLRAEIGRVVRIAANGGYRSPAHRLARAGSAHCWGSAANIYKIGDDWLDSREKIEKYVQIARSTLTSAWVRPYGERRGCAFDHLHIDLGYVVVEPHERDSAVD